ncbi:MAG: hypothetical protein JXA21_27735 [Anaerolineae bacterium]|nr:hypothetical protein [Anaerolineae bacterium]
MPARKPQNTWILVAGGAAIVVLIVLVVSLDMLSAPLDALIRAGALLGYIAVFLASLSSLFMRELRRYFGYPFLKLHHVVSVTGLAALAVHALSVAWRTGNLAVFLPEFSSLRAFFALGGRPAFWLIAVATLAAVLRKSLGNRWKLIHWLNYLAFILGTVHAMLIGPNFQHPGVRIVAGVMAAVLVVAFILRRRRGKK